MWSVSLERVGSLPGAVVDDYLVLTPKGVRDDLVSGVTILPVSNGRVILLRSFRHGVRRHVWEAARGFLDPGEDVRQAEARELCEETGLACHPDDLRFAGHVMPEASTIRGKTAVFVALSCRPTVGRDRSEPGLGECHRFSRPEIRRMLARFEIEDASTLAALYSYMSGLET